MVVFRSNRQPRYQQIADDLLQHIRAGHYSPGDLLPPLRQLSQDYRVCTVTVSSALAVLAHQGVIAVRHGLRAIVLAPNTDEDDLMKARQRVNAMIRRQQQILAQIAGMEHTLRRARQHVHELARLVHQLGS
ncbi:MAG: winged helix-turn-helix domain-containing protein [Pseudonocardiaceae bacterium]